MTAIFLGVTKVYMDLKLALSFPGGSVVTNTHVSSGDARDMGSISGLGRYLAEGNGNPLQHTCLGNPLDRGTWHLKESDRTEQLSTDQYLKYMMIKLNTDTEYFDCMIMSYLWADCVRVI